MRAISEVLANLRSCGVGRRGSWDWPCAFVFVSGGVLKGNRGACAGARAEGGTGTGTGGVSVAWTGTDTGTGFLCMPVRDRGALDSPCMAADLGAGRGGSGGGCCLCCVVASCLAAAARSAFVRPGAIWLVETSDWSRSLDCCSIFWWWRWDATSCVRV